MAPVWTGGPQVPRSFRTVHAGSLVRLRESCQPGQFDRGPAAVGGNERGRAGTEAQATASGWREVLSICRSRGAPRTASPDSRSAVTDPRIKRTVGKEWTGSESLSLPRPAARGAVWAIRVIRYAKLQWDSTLAFALCHGSLPAACRRRWIAARHLQNLQTDWFNAGCLARSRISAN